ncbi:Hypothetical protein BSM4216_0336 [Bacillus smithii]|nr:Hypothetical protein BSM4216_0336 [Bacillus smithii]
MAKKEALDPYQRNAEIRMEGFFKKDYRFFKASAIGISPEIRSKER